MLEAVFTFALITALGELVLLHSLPKFRRFILRTHGRELCLHLGFAAFNLWIHFGTVTGTMTGVTAFLVSVLVARLAKFMYARA